MADALFEKLSRFVERKLRKLPLLALRPGRVVNVNPDGTVDVAPDDAGELGKTGFSGIPLLVGLPGFTTKPGPGSKVRLLWDSASPGKPRAALFDSGGPVDEVRFDNGTKSVARVDDEVDCGTLTATAPSGGGPVVFTWTPANGDPPVVGASLPIIGYVRTGNDKLKA